MAVDSYATGLLLISPLGDLLPRRQLILALVLTSASLTVGLAVTLSLAGFEALSFLVGVVTVTPQVIATQLHILVVPAKCRSRY
jgi:hypothetical protein